MNAMKQARRDRAAERFNIMSKADWIVANSNKRKITPLGDGAYDDYVARKQQEKQALGL